ncbi:albusnodin/ikarugamycin family macrolactam cyclase [Amycolatopsis sp. EV170708-02-1]|uniref:albusnodin/ikarugamycin family macrolactam cyclase n=1 Tax=Amycolatopsis sp. EV170708-02-1 TaxID=2919322 RepID=UPI001F0C72B3|nr:albusnodin/ikarugamycin family macrolactam cyclase [Amycolatopsis sp. EV170708-02-1]UMP06894.1 albusnodin/ikarugamycin family macrolactam cyclase [Amycolatopsis sp. EV170708-02-1]
MRWFGGFSSPSAPPRRPIGGARLWPTMPGCWTVGTWPGNEVRTTWSGTRFVAVVGTCGIAAAELAQLGTGGVPDDVAWRWPGSYTTVEVTRAATRIWTDLGGAWPIYTTPADGGVYWASSSRALAGLTGAGPDLDRLAGWLLAPSVPVLLAERSAFEDIALVPPGHRLTIDGDNSRVNRVWQPRPRAGSPPRRLRNELAAAVAERLATATMLTSDLSGGFDSTALALLAAEQAGPGRIVTGVTVHPAGCNSGRDLDYAWLAAQRPGLAHRLMPLTGEHAPYAALDEVPVTDEPAPSTIAHARFAGQLRWIRDTLGTDCHFTGDGGDSLLCTPPIMLADLVSTGHHRRAVTETMRWARLRRLPTWPLLTTAIRTARTSRVDTLTTLANDLRADTAPMTRSDGDIGWYTTEPVPLWATQAARSRAAALAHGAAARLADLPGGTFATTVTAENMAEVGRSARADIQLAEHAGVLLANPFTDSRVIDAYLSVQLNAMPGPADYKPVLGAALSDLFPAKLAARSTKGDFNPDHYGGMRANLPALHALADGRLAALGLVDPAALRRTLTMTAAGLPVAFSTVEPAIAAEVWLRALADAPRGAWSAIGTRAGAA